jgi:hypothetical protein
LLASIGEETSVILDAYLEQDVVETPSLGCQNGRQTLLALFNEQGKIDSPRASISSGPGLSGTSVGRMPIGPKGLSVDPGLGNGINGLIAVQAEHFGHDGGGGDLDKNDVIETDTIEGVEEGKGTLDFMGFDHAFQDIFDSKGLTLAGQMVGDGEDGTQVIRGVSPWSEGRLCVEKRRKSNLHSAAKKQSLKSSQRMIVPILKAPRMGSSW